MNATVLEMRMGYLWLKLFMNCNFCGSEFHPELSACPSCGTKTPREARRRNRLLYLVNTLLVATLALGVLVSAVGEANARTGMTSADCAVASELSLKTRAAVLALEGDPEAMDELRELSEQWSALSENYTPGKFSWSTSGLEHNWLQRMGIVTLELANGEEVSIEQGLNPNGYIERLSRLLPRYCG